MPGSTWAERPEYLFVYGTLRRGWPHPMARLLARAARYAGPARCPGRLLCLGRYPGLVAGRGWVRGDLFRLPGRGSLLARLDRYEGCAGAHPEYRREQRVVTRPGGRAVLAWVYGYLGSTPVEIPIAGGDFCRHIKKRTPGGRLQEKICNPAPFRT